MRYLDVPYFKQDFTYTCGPASLQMVFAYYGIQESEKNLIKELKPNDDIGTKHQALIDASLKRNLYSYVNEGAPLEEIGFLISQKFPVIVHYREISIGEGHYSVVVSIEEKEVVLNDPWNGEGIALTHTDFLERWECGPEGLCTRWLMAVSDKPFEVGHQYIPKE